MFDMTQGVCKDEKDLDVFFPEDDGTYDRAKLRYAKFVCMGCPVRDLCREEGLTGQLETMGVWGGLTEKERRRVARGKDRPGPTEHAKAMAKATNRERSLMAARESMSIYIQGLEFQGAAMPADFRRVIEARINNPELSLAELGELLGLTKDGVSGRLRRLKESVMSGRKLDWDSPIGRKKVVLE